MLAVIYFGCGNAFGLWKSQNPVENSMTCGKLLDSLKMSFEAWHIARVGSGILWCLL